MSTGADPEVGSKQVLVDTFRNLVRYALRKTRRGVEALSVMPGSFTVDALEQSLRAASAPSLAALLERARQAPLSFVFRWSGTPLEACLELSFEPGGDLKVRLLWLALPEKVPISPRAGVVEGRRPLQEAVAELLRMRPGGQLEPYAPPG